MTWYDIRWNGQTYLENLSGADEKTLTALGIHGYATEAEAEANPQTMNDLQAALGGAQVLAGYSGSATNIPTPGSVATGAGSAASTASNTLSGLDAIGAFFNKLGEANTWLRIIKVVIGGVLVISGLVHLTGIDKTALGVASKAVIPA
jgi:hypothetical protein